MAAQAAGRSLALSARLPPCAATPATRMAARQAADRSLALSASPPPHTATTARRRSTTSF
eukprot:10889190-Heterocapsa_arctica.AAC.1